MNKISHKFLLDAFRYKKPRLNQDGTSPVYLRVGWKRDYRFIPTGINVSPANWDERKQRVKKHSQSVAFNLILSEIDSNIGEYNLQYLRGEITPDLDRIQNHILKQGSEEDPHEFFEKVLSQHSGETSTIKKHRIFLVHLRTYAPNLSFSAINYAFIKDFQNWLSKQKSKRDNKTPLSANYVASLMVLFKSYSNEAILNGLLKTDPFLGFKQNRTKKKKPHLTLKEVEALRGLDLSDRQGSVEESRDAFVFSCYTGLRFSDLYNLKVGSIKKTQNGWVMIVETIKTKKIIKINISKSFDGAPKEIIEPYLKEKQPHQLVFGPKNYKTYNKSFNEHLKSLQEPAGIEIGLSAHVSRHTCAMILINERGWDIGKIKTYLGHSDINTTQQYAEVLYRTLDEDF